MYVFKLECTRWDTFIRIFITVLYLKSCRSQLWIWRSQISGLLAPLRVASKTAFAIVKSTMDTPNSSNTVLLVLNWTLNLYAHIHVFQGYLQKDIFLNRSAGNKLLSSIYDLLFQFTYIKRRTFWVLHLFTFVSRISR